MLFELSFLTEADLLKACYLTHLYRQVLQEKGIHIWDDNASREFLDRRA
jgi:hypothetical protein